MIMMPGEPITAYYKEDGFISIEMDIYYGEKLY